LEIRSANFLWLIFREGRADTLLGLQVHLISVRKYQRPLIDHLVKMLSRHHKNTESFGGLDVRGDLGSRLRRDHDGEQVEMSVVGIRETPTDSLDAIV